MGQQKVLRSWRQRLEELSCGQVLEGHAGALPVRRRGWVVLWGKRWGTPSREKLKSIIWILKKLLCSPASSVVLAPFADTAPGGNSPHSFPTPLPRILTVQHHITAMRPCISGLSSEPGGRTGNGPFWGCSGPGPGLSVDVTLFFPVTPAQPQSLIMGWVQGRFAGCLVQIWSGLAELISVWGLFECMAQWEWAGQTQCR